MASYIARRKFLATLLGGTAVAWPLAARAQQTAMQVVRRINDTAMNLSAVRVNAGRRRFHGR
jgi:hypothetical protein